MLPRGVKYIADQEKGIFRKRRGRGFCYLDCNGCKIVDPEIVDRISSLVIPPNWKEVWICEDPSGHLQATGYDEKGRKQYLYHPKYSEYQQKNKYDRLYEFGSLLPTIRAKVQRDLKREGWPKEKVLALIVKIMDGFHLRVGSDRYREENETYGITTLRRKHIKKKRDRIELEYKAKSGKYRKIDIVNPALRKLIKETSELPGYEMFRYIDDEGKSRKINSQDVNDYIKSIANEEFTAKHFRTWGGTVAAVEESDAARKEIETNPQKKLETAIIRRVAERLGNTIATCREYYVHPGVLKSIIANEKIELKHQDFNTIKNAQLLKNPEKVVLSIIRK